MDLLQYKLFQRAEVILKAIFVQQDETENPCYYCYLSLCTSTLI